MDSMKKSRSHKNQTQPGSPRKRKAVRKYKHGGYVPKTSTKQYHDKGDYDSPGGTMRGGGAATKGLKYTRSG